MKRFASAILLVLAFCSLPLLAAERWQLGIDLPFYLYEDKQGQMVLDDFLALPVSSLNLQTRPLSQGFTPSAFWLKTSIPGHIFSGEELWMQIDPVFIDQLTLYYRQVGTQQWLQANTGDRWLGQRNSLDYNIPVLRLPSPEQDYELIVRIQSTSTVILNIVLMSAPDFLAFSSLNSILAGFYYATLLFALILGLTQAIIVKSRLYWAISAFITMSLLLVFSVQGHVVWLFGKELLTVQHYLVSIMTLIAACIPVWISSEALQLRQVQPRRHRLVTTWLILSALTLISPFLQVYSLMLQIQSLLSLVMAVLLSASAVSLWRQQRIDTEQLILGNMTFISLFLSLPALLILHGLIPYYPEIRAISQYSALTCAPLIMFFAIRHTRKEQQLNQQSHQLNRELNIEREARFHQRQFMGLVSHEFRTPLAIISGALQNMQTDPANQIQHNRYQRMQRATNRLIQLTDNCLLDARLSADALYLEYTDTDLGLLLRTAAVPVDISGHHQLHICHQGLGTTLEQLPGLPLQADTALLTIALSNLLDNAVKYTEQGRILVDIRKHRDHYIISIHDEGQGIPENQSAQLFERYHRIKNAALPYRPGAGLGLYAAHQIVQAHSGELRLASNTPAGCCFEITIPINQRKY